MCRNITTLRGLEPAATAEEIEAAARQYIRKITGVQTLSAATREPFEAAVVAVAEITARVLDELPERRRPPASLPPLRRLGHAGEHGTGGHELAGHEHGTGGHEHADHEHGTGGEEHPVHDHTHPHEHDHTPHA